MSADARTGRPAQIDPRQGDVGLWVPEIELIAGGAYAAVFRVPSRSGSALVDLTTLNEDERSRMRSYRRIADQIRYAFAHVVLRALIGGRLGLSPHSLKFGRDQCPVCGGPHGRPSLVTDGGQPLEFSLSHGGSFVAIGVADRQIGVDVQPRPDVSLVRDVLQDLHPSERAEVVSSPPEEQAARFNRMWVRKEAYLKALGTGLSRDLGADDLTAAPGGWLIVDRDVQDVAHVAVAVPSPDSDGRGRGKM